MADGYVMTIPASVLKKLENADNSIKKIAETSEDTQKRVVAAFQEMANGVNPLIEKINALKGFTKKRFDNIFKGATTEAEKTAASVASVVKELNAMNSTSKDSSAKSSVNDWMSINESLKVQQARLKEINQSIKQYETTLAAVKSGSSGVISKSDTSAYQANIQEAETIKQTIALMQQRQQAIVTYENEQTNLIRKMEQLKSLAQGKNSFVEEKDIRELERLNEAFRKGESELQKRARLTDEYRRSVEASNKADKERSNKFSNQQEKATKAAAKAEEQYNEALKRSERTLTQREAKIRALERAQRALNATGRNYAIENNKIAAEIQRLSQKGEQATTSIKKLGQAQRHTFDISGQLERQLALVFSVSAIKGYIEQLVSVRGEFELQQRALQSILQNKDQANEIWDKTVQLAVSSPFTVKELVTYTKQLAAYRIEADKLYDTNKMLADVSAGLGVGMDRLILAFGQVKAANFLRASEVRQFSEAGVNMLGELANLYTELEGKMVSVGDVQERITKRMVTFGDVEEIFKRITSAGGIFYNMQEIQAETLAGQMSNLRDTFDLMFNDIGKANDGLLKGFVAALREIVDNWRLIAAIAIPTITTLGSRFVILKVASLTFGRSWAKTLLTLRTGFRVLKSDLGMATVATNRLNSSMRTLGMTRLSIWTTALSAVVLIIWEIYEALSAASRQQRELNKIAAEGQSNAVSMASNYERLANVVSDSTKSFEEQDEALKELKRTYADILPDHLLEAKTIRDLQGNYEGATQAIYNYMDVKTKESQIRVINEEDGKVLQKNTEQFAEKLKDLVSLYTNADVPMEKFRKVLSILNEEIRKGTLEQENYGKRLQELVREWIGVEIPELKRNDDPLSRINMSKFDIQADIANRYFIKFTTKAREFANKINKIFNSNINVGTYIQDRLKGEQEKIDKAVKNAQSAWNTLVEFQKGNPVVTQEQVDSAKKVINEVYTYLGKMAPDVNKILNNAMLIHDETIELNKSGYFKMIQYIANLKIPVKDKESYIKEMEKLQKAMNSLDGTPVQKLIRSMMESFAKANKIDIGLLVDNLGKDTDSIESYVERLVKTLPSLKETLELLQNNGSLLRRSMTDAEAKKKIEDTKADIAWIEHLKKNNTWKEPKGKSEQEKTLERQLQLLKDVKKAYEENRKYYNEEDAATKTKQDYSKAFDEAKFPKGFLMSMELDPSGIINSMQEIASKVSGEVKLKFEKAIANIQAEVGLKVRIEGIEEAKSEIEDIFRNYEITVSMKNAFPNMDKEKLGKLFDFEPESLESAQEKVNQIWIKKANEREKILAEEQNREAKIYTDGAEAAASLGAEAVKDYKKQMLDVTAYRKKELEKRLKDFAKFLDDSLDKVKRIKTDLNADLEYATQLFKQGKIDASEYAEIVKNVNAEADKKIGEENISNFKDDPDYIKMIGDVSQYSREELGRLANKLRDFISLNAGKMDSNQLDGFYDDLTKIQDEMNKVNENNPFSGGLIASLKELRKARKEYNEALDLQKQKQEEVKQAAIELKEAEEEAAKVREKYKDNLDSPEAQEEMGKAADNVSNSTLKLQDAKGSLKEANGLVDQSGAKVKGLEGKMGGVLGIIDKIVTAIYQGIKATIELMEHIEELASSRGIDTDKGGWREVKQAGKILGDVNEGVMSSWQKFKNKDYAGATADMAGAVISIFTNLNKQHDDRLQQKIEEETELVTRLGRAYQHLARDIENAYTIDTVNKSYKNAEENIKQQMESTQRMIAAEEGKKDGDANKIAEWQDQMIQYQEQLEDLRNQRLQELGGFGSGSAVKDAAEDFVSAWLEAYKETGDGLEALEEKMDEFIQNMIVKQLSLKVTESFIKPITDKIDKALEGDSNLDADEAQDIYDTWDKIKGNLNNTLLDLIEGLGDLAPEAGSASELSGLQKGIQSVTEETAGIIEGYLNSIRFFVSDSNIQLQTIASFFSADPAQNPMFSEMMAQTRLLRSIDDRLSSVITSAGNHELGGFAIKAFI